MFVPNLSGSYDLVGVDNVCTVRPNTGDMAEAARCIITTADGRSTGTTLTLEEVAERLRKIMGGIPAGWGES